MKKLTVSIVTLFFVLFGSIFTASAEETTTIRIGEIKGNKILNYYSYPVMATVVGKLASGTYDVYGQYNGAYKTYANNKEIWLSPKDVTFTPYQSSPKGAIGYITTTKEISTYSDYNVPKGEYRLGIIFNVYSYEKGMFLGNLPNNQGDAWVSEKDVDFSQNTYDKDTPVSTTTIGRVASIDGDVTIYNDSKPTATSVGTLKQDDFETTLEVKGKVNGYYNVGTNKWIAENPDKVRFFPTNAETDMYKFVYDVRKWEGTPYQKWGIFTNNGGFDEIGFIYRNFKDARYTIGRMDVGTYEFLSKKVTKPHIGDLIFFKPDASGKRNVGIIVSEKQGKMKYIAATQQDGVKVYKFNTTDTNISGYGRYR